MEQFFIHDVTRAPLINQNPRKVVVIWQLVLRGGVFRWVCRLLARGLQSPRLVLLMVLEPHMLSYVC
jgi:hypothetical protein